MKIDLRKRPIFNPYKQNSIFDYTYTFLLIRIGFIMTKMKTNYFEIDVIINYFT